MESSKTVTISCNGERYLLEGSIEGIIDAKSHPNTYKIRTLTDMLTSVKKESLPYFLKDLENIFQTYYEMHEMDENFTIKQFQWVDDSDSKICVNIRVKDTEDNEQLVDLLETHCVKL